MSGQPDPPGVVYVATDIPAGVSIAEWRRRRAAQPLGRHQSSRARRMLQRVRGSIKSQRGVASKLAA